MIDEVNDYLKRIGLNQITLNREYNVYILNDRMTDIQDILRNDIRIGCYNISIINKLYLSTNVANDVNVNNKILILHIEDQFNELEFQMYLKQIIHLVNSSIKVYVSLSNEVGASILHIMSNYGLCPTEWGGDIEFINKSEIPFEIARFINKELLR